eukprot:767973-Hanusia_phi.AAC.8
MSQSDRSPTRRDLNTSCRICGRVAVPIILHCASERQPGGTMLRRRALPVGRGIIVQSHTHGPVLSTVPVTGDRMTASRMRKYDHMYEKESGQGLYRVGAEVF